MGADDRSGRAVGRAVSIACAVVRTGWKGWSAACWRAERIAVAEWPAFRWSTARRSAGAAATAPTGDCTTVTTRGLGRTVDCELTPARVGEHLRRVKVAAGDIWLGDRNYAKGDGLHHVVQGGADFVVRELELLVAARQRGQPFDMARRLKRLGKAGRAHWRAIVHTPDGKTVPSASWSGASLPKPSSARSSASPRKRPGGAAPGAAASPTGAA